MKTLWSLLNNFVTGFLVCAVAFLYQPDILMIGRTLIFGVGEKAVDANEDRTLPLEIRNSLVLELGPYVKNRNLSSVDSQIMYAAAAHAESLRFDYRQILGPCLERTPDDRVIGWRLNFPSQQPSDYCVVVATRNEYDYGFNHLIPTYAIYAYDVQPGLSFRMDGDGQVFYTGLSGTTWLPCVDEEQLALFEKNKSDFWERVKNSK